MNISRPLSAHEVILFFCFSFILSPTPTAPVDILVSIWTTFPIRINHCAVVKMAQARDSLFGVLPTPINLPHPYVQAPEPTKAPRRPARRQQTSSSDPGTIYYAPDNTCGYVDGVESNFFACGQQSTCVIYTSTLGVPGHIMCQIRDHYQLQTACINSSDQCDDDCASNTAKLKW